MMKMPDENVRMNVKDESILLPAAGWLVPKAPSFRNGYTVLQSFFIQLSN